jgi:hypothetical protein
MRMLVMASAAAVALASPAGASSAREPMVHVSGSGFGSGFLAGDHVEVGSRSNADGTDATGHLEVEGLLNGTEPIHQRAAVECVRAEGNRAVVVGRLPEPFTSDQIPGLVFTHAAVLIEDNGPPEEGQPVDRMVDFILRETTAQAFCSTDLAFAFLPLATPITSGNYVVSTGSDD